MADENQCYIFYKEILKTPGHDTLTERQLTIQGKTLKEVELVWDRKAKKVFKE